MSTIRCQTWKLYNLLPDMELIYKVLDVKDTGVQ